MRLYITILSLGLSIFFNDAYAAENQWSEEVEIELFTQCYDKEIISKILEKCNYAKQCINAAPKNSTSIGMKDCSKKSYEIWDQKLNQEYKVMSSLVGQIYGEDALSSLIQSQRSWIKFRDEDCKAKYERRDYLGAIGGATYQSCRSQHTSKRAIEFKQESNHWIAKGYSP